MRRIQSGQSGEMMVNRIAGQFGGAPFKYFGEWTERVAKGELPKHKPPRPTGAERNLVVTTWEWSQPNKYLHDLISSDRRNPHRQCQRPAVRLAGILDRRDADPRPEDAQGHLLQDAGRRSEHAGLARAGPRRRRQADRSRRPIGATTSCGTPRPTTTTPCSATTAACGSPPTRAAWTIPRSARRAPITRRPRSSRSIARRGR